MFPSCLSSPASLLQGGFGDEERNAIRTAHGADDDHQVAGGVSPVYGPPEVLNDEEQQASPSFPKKWDVYSYAALMYEVFAGEGYFQELKVRMPREEEKKRIREEEKKRRRGDEPILSCACVAPSYFSNAWML